MAPVFAYVTNNLTITAAEGNHAHIAGSIDLAIPGYTRALRVQTLRGPGTLSARNRNLA
jgi:hypothetical protein